MFHKIQKAVFLHPKKLKGNFANMVQFFRFGVAGGFSAILEIGVLFFLVKNLHLNYLIANAIAFTAANILNYFLSRIWVYGESKYAIGVELTGFFIAGLIGLAINQLVLFVLYDKLTFALLVSKIIAICITVAWNFFSKKHIVFKY